MPNPANLVRYFAIDGTAKFMVVSDYMITVLMQPDLSSVISLLGLGTMSAQNANAVAITGGDIQGVTIHNLVADVTIADGGTGASTAAQARINLGLQIGTNVQAWSANLDAWSAKVAPAGVVLGATDTQTLTNKTIDAALNAISNLTVPMFAANVVDPDPTMAANSASRIPTQSAVVGYVQNFLTGITWKQAVSAATTANITLSGPQTIDGVSVVAGNRVLVKNQTTQTQNGIYAVAAGAWTRTLDADTGAELVSATMLVIAGTLNGDTQWTCSNDSITIGTTNITFVQLSGAGTYSAGFGITLTGNQFSITNAALVAWANLTPAADQLGYFTSGTVAALTSFPAFGRSIVGSANAAAARTTIGAVNIGGDTMTGSLSVPFLSVTVDSGTGLGGNQMFVGGSQSGQSPLRPVTIEAAGTSTDTNVGIALIPKGAGALMADRPDNTAAGGNVRGNGAVDWQMSRSAATAVASGAGATIVGGVNNAATGQASTAGGQNVTASGLGATAFGNATTAAGAGSTVTGATAMDRGINGILAFSGNRLVSNGDAMFGDSVHMFSTAGAAAVRLTTDGAAVSTSNTLVMPNNSAYRIRVSMVIRDTVAGTAWTFDLATAVFHRAATAASTIAGASNPVFIAGPTVNTPAAIVTVPTATADTTNGSINISVTPPVGNTNALHIVARVFCEQVL